MSERESQEGQIPSLKEFVRTAHVKFGNTTSYINESGRTEAYGTLDAAEDTLKDSGMGPAELLISLSRQTLHAPADFDFAGVNMTSWNTFFSGCAQIILEQELLDAHPNEREEHYRRLEAVERTRAYTNFLLTDGV